MRLVSATLILTGLMANFAIAASATSSNGSNAPAPRFGSAPNPPPSRQNHRPSPLRPQNSAGTNANVPSNTTSHAPGFAVTPGAVLSPTPNRPDFGFQTPNRPSFGTQTPAPLGTSQPSVSSGAASVNSNVGVSSSRPTFTNLIPVAQPLRTQGNPGPTTPTTATKPQNPKSVQSSAATPLKPTQNFTALAPTANSNNCVYYLSRDLGVKLPTGLSSFSDKQKAINVSDTPKVGDVAIIKVNSGPFMQDGHVALVTGVSNNSITIKEAHWKGAFPDTRVSTAADLGEAQKNLNIVGYYRPR